MKQPTLRKYIDHTLFVVTALLLIIYIGIFFYLNMCKYTQHVDSDIAVDAMLAREIWEEKTLTPDNWISSTERLVVGVPAISSVFYGITGSMVFSMGLACAITGGLLLCSIALVFKRCRMSHIAIVTGLLALLAMPINGLRNDGQMVPFVQLLWFLFADYYALHSVCLFLSIAFYLYLREKDADSDSKIRFRDITIWIFLTGLCGGLALGGMRALQVIVLPLTIFEILSLFFGSKQLSAPLPKKRFAATGFIFSLLAVGAMAKLYPTNVEYPMYIQDAAGMADRLTSKVPAAILECLGIAGGCTLNSFAALMQLGILAFLALILYGLFFLFGQDKATGQDHMNFRQKVLITALFCSFLLTVVIETVTNAEPAHNYFFVIWFVCITVLASLITWAEKNAHAFGTLIIVCVCGFALCNIFYTYRDCAKTTDNLKEYEEVIEYMESQNISHGYAEFWDASRICVMTDGRITMGHCYHMEDLHMYWWTTSTKWYVPNLPVEMPTAYVVCRGDETAFEAQFEDPSVVSVGFWNDRFTVYVSDQNLVKME